MNDCPFCDFQDEIIVVDPAGFLIHPLNPVTPGHLLAIPWKHVEHFSEDPSVTAAIARFAAAWCSDGRDWNLITSKGPSATQTVKHLHFHLVPRREGDGLHLPWTGQK